MAIKKSNGFCIFKNDSIKFRKCQIINNFNFHVLFLNHCRFIFQLPDGRIEGNLSKRPKSWTYITLNFNVKQQVLWIYEDGVHVRTQSTKREVSGIRPGNGRIVVGKVTSNDRQGGFASVEADELRLFNRVLTEAEIKILSQRWIESSPETLVFLMVEIIKSKYIFPKASWLWLYGSLSSILGF